MLKEKYLNQIARIISPVLKDKPVRVFLFGSSARKERFGDCDLGFLGEIADRDMRKIKEAMAESTLPYKVDVVNFNNVSSEFRESVFNQPVIWIKR